MWNFLELILAQFHLTSGRLRSYCLLMDHSPGFLKLVNEAKRHVHEVTIDEARQRLEKNPEAVLMDVREESEWEKAHAARLFIWARAS